MDDLKNIFTNSTPLSNDQLKDYLKDSTSDADKHEIEKSFDEVDDFTNEAVEGLLISKTNIDLTLFEIDSKIHKKLKNKKVKKNKKLKDYNSVLITTVLLLLLAIFSFIIIKLLLKKG